MHVFALRKELHRQTFSSFSSELCTCRQSRMPWAHKQGSCPRESQAFQRLAKRFKGQKIVIHSSILARYFYYEFFQIYATVTGIIKSNPCIYIRISTICLVVSSTASLLIFMQI